MRGSWKLEANMWDDEDNDIELNDIDLEHIAEQVKEGMTSGLLFRDE